MQALNDEQLTFEQLKRLTSVKDREDTDSPPLEKHYREIEKRLREVIDEYEDNRYLIQDGGALDLTTLPWTAGFLKYKLKVEKQLTTTKELPEAERKFPRPSGSTRWHARWTR
jgi:hypothetical protein